MRKLIQDIFTESLKLMNSFVSSDDTIKSPRVPFLIDISAEATLINEPRKVSECVKLILSVLSHLKCKCKLAVSHSCLLLDFHWHLPWCQFSTNISISLSPSPSSSSLWTVSAVSSFNYPCGGFVGTVHISLVEGISWYFWVFSGVKLKSQILCQKNDNYHI